MRKILTPENSPNHQTIGQNFIGHDGFEYFCDSFDSSMGFWMTRVDCPEDRKNDSHSEFRRNVSLMAIGRTFHAIFVDLETGTRSANGWFIDRNGKRLVS